jgi:hypothetical protein
MAAGESAYWLGKVFFEDARFRLGKSALMMAEWTESTKSTESTESTEWTNEWRRPLNAINGQSQTKEIDSQTIRSVKNYHNFH